MELHHQESIDRAVGIFASDTTVQCVILGGSLAHGYARSDSDIDVSIIIDKKQFCEQEERGELHYFNSEVCTYDGGYIDGKYTTLEFLHKVAEKGSEPARYAFKDARVLFTRVSGIGDLLQQIATYPMAGRRDRIVRFVAQLLAWKWYLGEAVKQDNVYLRYLSVQKIVLFTGRIVLAVNERLYPYHKWLLRELESASRKPDSLIEHFHELLEAPKCEIADTICAEVFECYDIDPKKLSWPNQFIIDSELNWIDNEAPIDDI